MAGHYTTRVTQYDGKEDLPDKCQAEDAISTGRGGILVDIIT